MAVSEDRAAALDELLRRKGISEERRNAAVELFRRGRSYDDVLVIVGLKPKELEKPKVGVGDVAATVGAGVMSGFATTGGRVGSSLASAMESTAGRHVDIMPRNKLSMDSERAPEITPEAPQQAYGVPVARQATFREQVRAMRAAKDVRAFAQEPTKYWEKRGEEAAGKSKTLKKTGDIIAGTTDVLSTMALSALAGPAAPAATGAFYASSSYDEFQQKAREEMSPPVMEFYKSKGVDKGQAEVMANSFVDKLVADENFINAMLQGTLDAASEYVFMGLFPKVGGKIAGSKVFTNAINDALLALKKSPAADKAVRFLANWAFEQGTEEVQNIGQRALEVKAGIKGSGLTPLEEAASQREQTLLVTGLMSAIGLSGNTDVSPEVVKGIQEKINDAFKDPTPKKKYEATRALSEVDPKRGADLANIFDVFKSSAGKTREQVKAEINKKIKNEAVKASILEHVDDFFDLQDELKSEQKLARVDELTGQLNRTGWKRGYAEQGVLPYDERRKAGHTILYSDLDNFKAGVNDPYGDVEGDRAIKENAELIAGIAAKHTGVIARPMGDEILLDFAPGTDVKAVAEEMRVARENTPFIAKDGKKVKLTLSIGIGKPGGLEHEANYAAKLSKFKGRNTVSTAEEIDALTPEQRAEIKAKMEQGRAADIAYKTTKERKKRKKKVSEAVVEGTPDQQGSQPEVQPTPVVEADNLYMRMPLERVQIDAEKGVVAAKKALAARQNEPTAGRATVGASATSLAEPFYSKLEKVIQDKMPARMSSEELSGMIANSGIKQDELNFSGMVDFLQENKGKIITKEQVQKFLDENRVTVEVKHLGGEKGDVLKTSLDDPEIAGPVATLRRFKIEPAINPIPGVTVGFIPEDGSPVQSSDFDTDNEQDLDDLMGHFVFGKRVPRAVLNRVLQAMRVIENHITSGGQQESTMYNNYKLPGGENYTEVLVSWNPKDGDFTSRHFGRHGKNLLYHIRMDERVVNGKKVLFVEEIQSDWHQKGREYGYKGNEKLNPDGLPSSIVIRKRGDLYEAFEDGMEIGVNHDRAALVNSIKEALAEEGFSEDELAVPPAPLAKNWHEQAVKRVIRYAAEKGLDGIAWTTGTTQSERYRDEVVDRIDTFSWFANNGEDSEGLSHLVEYEQEKNYGMWEDEYMMEHRVRTRPERGELSDFIREKVLQRYTRSDKIITASKNGGEVATFVLDKDGMITGSTIDGAIDKNIREVLGADLSEKIMSSDQGKVSGQDITVGGEGMRGFYDKMLVDYANKLGRKYGVKVQEGTTSTTPEKIKVNFKVPTDPGTQAMIDMPPFGDGTPPMAAVTTMYVDGKPETVDVFLGGDGMTIMADNGEWAVDTKYLSLEDRTQELQHDSERARIVATKALEDPNSPIWQNFQVLKGGGPARDLAFLPTDKRLEATHFMPIPDNMRSDVLYVGQEFFAGMPLGKLFTEGIYTKFFNRYAPIENIWKKAEKEYGGELPHGMNLTERAREYLGIAGKVTATLNDATFTIDPDGNIEKTGEGLRPIIQDYQAISGNEDENLNDLGLYLEAQRVIADARLTDQGAKRVTLEGGADPYQVMKDLRDKYGNDLDKFDDIAQRVYGYQDRVLHLLVDSGILSQEQFDKIKKDNPSYIPFDRLVDEDFFIGGPVAKKAFTEAKNPLRMIKGSELPIVNPFESIIKNTFVLLDRAERNHVAKSLAQLKNLVPDDISVEKIPVVEVAAEGDKSIFRPNRFSPPKGVIEYYDGGVRKWLKIEDENLYNAMSGLSETQAGLMVKLLSKPSNWLRTGVVISPEFWARNSIRDQFTAFLQTDFNPKSLFDTVGSIADILGKRETYYDWLRSGGAYSGFVDVNRDNLKRILEDVKKDPNLIWKLNVLQTAQDISSVIENATRLGVYKRAKIRGESDVAAGFKSREATVDFARRGTMMKEINSLWAFFNPSLQGVDKFVRTMRDKPKETTLKALATVTLPSIALWAINHDDDEYKEMAPWLKDLFWNFKVGSTWYRVPKPYMYGQLFGSSVERFLDYLQTKDPEAIKQFTQSIIDAASPIQGDETGILMPTAARPLIENATNWSFFRQAPLVSGAKVALDPRLQYGPGTTEAAKRIGGMINYSPAKLENLVRGWTGTTGYDLLKLASLVMGDKKPKPPKQASDYFFVKGFTSRNPLISPESGNRFYKNWAKLDSEYKSYNKYIDLGEIQHSNEINKKYKDVELVYTIVSRAKSRLNDIDDEIDRVPLEIQDEKEQRTKLAQLYSERLEIYRLANQVMLGKADPTELQNRGMTNEPSEKPPRGLGNFAPPTPRIGRP